MKTTPRVSNPNPNPNPNPTSQLYIDDDHYEDDGFVVDDVDNCEQLQSLIRQLVRPQGYDPELSISFFIYSNCFSLISTEKLLRVQIIKLKKKKIILDILVKKKIGQQFYNLFVFFENTIFLNNYQFSLINFTFLQ